MKKTFRIKNTEELIKLIKNENNEFIFLINTHENFSFSISFNKSSIHKVGMSKRIEGYIKNNVFTRFEINLIEEKDEATLTVK